MTSNLLKSEIIAACAFVLGLIFERPSYFLNEFVWFLILWIISYLTFKILDLAEPKTKEMD